MQYSAPLDMVALDAQRAHIRHEERAALERLAREELRLARVDEQAALERVDSLRVHIEQTPLDARVRLALFHRLLDACTTLIAAGQSSVLATERLDELAAATLTAPFRV